MIEKDEEIEERIIMEVVVDAYDKDERAMAWFYYIAEGLEPEQLLDKDVFDYLNKKCDSNPEKMRVLINDWLRKDIEIARSVS